jgi:hypothetical protein
MTIPPYFDFKIRSTLAYSALVVALLTKGADRDKERKKTA